MVICKEKNYIFVRFLQEKIHGVNYIEVYFKRRISILMSLRCGMIYKKTKKKKNQQKTKAVTGKQFVRFHTVQ